MLRNTLGTKKIQQLLPYTSQKEKKTGPLACLLISLIVKNFYAYLSSLPIFFALANGMGTNSETKVLLWK